ncbi:DUF2169 domain-containing protein [Rubrivirga sp. IMCC43871]|uniref:DUF2169 family type VI secretion system accessory protein n=1 Tax=Rubrivirga sp. IMCC43871 TaxID=3391575 RepID=UPI00399000A7
MDIRNETPFAHGLVIGMGPDRQAHLAVVVKGTFRIPERPGDPVEVADQPIPFATADAHHQDDPTASVRTESDAVVHKPRADVMLAGHAYAPGGRATTETDILLRVGRLEQVIRVIGDRHWEMPMLGGAPTPSAPVPFTAMPLVFERAFGGSDHEGGGLCAENPLGRGYIHGPATAAGTRLPNLENPRQLIRTWNDRPAPVGWGVFGQAWSPRSQMAGRSTELHPQFGLPEDFDPRFHNGAHPGLQLRALAGDEEVELLRVTPDGRRRFALPGRTPRVSVRTRTTTGPNARVSEPSPLTVVLDTLVLLPDDGVFTLTWRASRALALAPEAALALVASVEITESGSRAGTTPG